MLTVVVRSKNDVALIERTLSGIRRACGEPVELIGIDSGSTDGTLEVQARHVDRLFRLPPERYLPGAVLNFAAEQARGDIVVFLNSDCVPRSPRWLEALVAPLRAGLADATFGRQDPRPDAWSFVARDHARAFGDAGPTGPFFSAAVSAFPRALLLAAPFPIGVRFSEDLAWAWTNRSRARVRYVPAARVEHSHNYPLQAAWRRFAGEGAADAHIFAGSPPPNASLPRALASACLAVVRDAAHGLRLGAWRDVGRAGPQRVVQRLAYWWGHRAEARRLRAGQVPNGASPERRDWEALLQVEEVPRPVAPRVSA